MKVSTIRQSAYDRLYDNNWSENNTVVLYGAKVTSFETLVQFATFMSKNLGFRLRMTCRGNEVHFTRVN